MAKPKHRTRVLSTQPFPPPPRWVADGLSTVGDVDLIMHKGGMLLIQHCRCGAFRTRVEVNERGTVFSEWSAKCTGEDV